jgi:hypothetical protein
MSLFAYKQAYVRMLFLAANYLNEKKKQFSFNNRLNFSYAMSKKSCTFDIEYKCYCCSLIYDF